LPASLAGKNTDSFDTPNYSGRMDNLRAAILRPQLADLQQQCNRWNARMVKQDAHFSSKL
jgi:dTDP-4-amino-4,6-dideoxygalactose transaminase